MKPERPDTSFNAHVGDSEIEFTGRRFDYTPGYYVKTVEGLILGGSTRYSSASSGAGDGEGEFDAPNLRVGPRIIVLTGFVYATSMRKLGHMLYQRLGGLLAERDDVDWFHWEEFGEGYRTEVRGGTNSPPKRRGSTGIADYTIRFRAPSQRAFGAEHPPVSGTVITIPNEGSYHACPTLTITGSMPGYRLVGDDGTVHVVTESISPGDTHVIDMTDGILVRNGVAEPSGIPRPITVPAHGHRTITLVPDSGSGLISCTPVDNYI